MKKAILFSIIALGFTAMTSQIVLLREMLVVFYGNEISISYILASWLIGGALGSLILGRLADKIKDTTRTFVFSQLLLAGILPLAIIAVRSIKFFLELSPGEIIPFSYILIASFTVLVPLCALLGFTFTISCRVFKPDFGTPSPASKIGTVYMLEASGAMIGGLLASFFLVRMMTAMNIMLFLGLINVAAAISVSFLERQKKARTFLMTLSLVMLIIGCLMGSAGIWGKIDRLSVKKQWQGYDLLATTNSIYGNIAVTKRGEQRSFFKDGLRLYTVPDEKTAEESVHFTLLEHPDPRTVLLLGGGPGGTIKETLKHNVDAIDYIELDPEIIKVAECYLLEEESAYLKNKKVRIENVDGRFFIKNTDKKYDCIIINIGDPRTAQLNRYYTVEFFKEVSKILKDKGIFAISLTSSENYINNQLRDFLASIYRSLKIVFKDTKIIPGNVAYFLSCKNGEVLTYDYNILEERRKERGVDAKYVRDYYLFSRLSPEKIEYIEDVLEKGERTRINHDFKPVSYYYAMVSWASLFRDSLFKKILENTDEEKIRHVTLFMIGTLLLVGGVIRKKASFRKQAVMTAVMTTGFTEMTFQIVILLSFQAIYGYVFYKLSLILTSFMVGLVLGSMVILKNMDKEENCIGKFITTQIAVCVYPLILPLLFIMASRSGGSDTSWIWANIVFPFTPVIAGFIGGVQFPLAGKIYLGKDKTVGKIAGINYGMDLIGACLGAVLTGTFLMPVLGIYKTCFLVATVNFAVLILLLFSLKKKPKLR